MGKLVLQPFTKITNYDSISRFSNRAIIGNIGNALYEDEKSREAFYQSKIGMKNKEIIAELVSEIYTFINKILSKYSDPETYKFRIYFNLEIDDKKGEILGKPSFDVDLFKHIGKIKGQYSDKAYKKIKIISIESTTSQMSQYILEAIRLVRDNVPLLDYEHYRKYHDVPEKIRDKIDENQSYIIINDKTYVIKYDVKENQIYYYVEKNENMVSLNSHMEIFNFILSELELYPEIYEKGTIFQYSDNEIKNIKNNIQYISFESEEQIDKDIKMINETTKILDDINEVKDKLLIRKKMKKEYRNNRDELIQSLQRKESLFNQYKINLLSQKELLKGIEKDYKEGIITMDAYNAQKLKSTQNILENSINISKIYNDVVKKTKPSIDNLYNNIYVKKEIKNE